MPPANITLCSEIITQLIPQKLLHAMITRILRNPARKKSSEIFWRNDKMAIAQIYSWRHATRTVRKQRATTRLRNPPEQFPKSYFAQSIATISRNPSESNSSIIFSRAQCFLNGGYMPNQNAKACLPNDERQIAIVRRHFDA